MSGSPRCLAGWMDGWRGLGHLVFAKFSGYEFLSAGGLYPFESAVCTPFGVCEVSPQTCGQRLDDSFR